MWPLLGGDLSSVCVWSSRPSQGCLSGPASMKMRDLGGFGPGRGIDQGRRDLAPMCIVDF